jgi:hypothetical protein
MHLIKTSEVIKFEKMLSLVKFLLDRLICFYAWRMEGMGSSFIKNLSRISLMTDNFSIHCEASITAIEGDSNPIYLLEQCVGLIS